ncbi:hypothetical protein SAMN05444159_4023 [Bradyrhizobium lablabi]|uniref:Uncharacterized protein n=1 Tax=Bradyrhizobium lablabi TaxID=722472 RepID=A0A1M6UTA4_9BRAD|nr:hypothetical protein SAMN05444159_4023 [Bradyrhizobium lablabi]
MVKRVSLALRECRAYIADFAIRSNVTLHLVPANARTHTPRPCYLALGLNGSLQLISVAVDPVFAGTTSIKSAARPASA